MAVNYSLPPFLGQPADPASHYATGLQIGVRIGEANAAQAYQQQQLLRQQAQDAFEQQYQTAKLNLDVDKIRRKQQAISGYQADVQSGMPAEQALMKWGPELGESINETLRTKAMGEERKATQAFRQQQLAETQAYHQDLSAERAAATAERERAARAREEETARSHREMAESRNAQNVMRAEKAMESDTVLGQLQSSLLDANSAVENAHWWTSDATLSDLKKKATEAATAVEQRKQQLLNRFGVKTRGVEEAAPEPASEAPSAQPTSPTTKTGKVHVRNPNGKTGWIPESQLEEALAEGYEQF